MIRTRSPFRLSKGARAALAIAASISSAAV